MSSENLATLIEKYDLNIKTNPKGTDKLWPHKYIEDFYETEFKVLQLKPIKILEIGFRHGASLFLWSNYFPNAQILGLDNQSDLAVNQSTPVDQGWIDAPRIKTQIGDAYSHATAYEVANDFDVIIGNPPFQKPNKTEGRSSLWDKFIIRSMDKLKDDGYLCFITPSSWRKPAHKLYNDMTQKSQLVYLHIYGVKECKKIFNVNSRVDLYILHKKQKYKDTIVVDEKDIMSKLNLSNWHFIPNFGLDVFSPIMTTKDNGIKIIFSKLHFQVNTKSQQNGVVSKVKTPDHNFPIRHSHTRKNGEIIFWCNADDIKNKKLLGVPKVILIRGNYTYPLNDFEGKYALSNYSFGIPISTKEEGDAIVKAVNSDKFDILLKATKWSMGFTHHNMFKYIVEDFYKYF
ncbi:hypothetical protein EBU94_08080 [bacterium]|nr:hypothetical protein [bacterium]